jgi:hypothetical protein
MDPLLVDRLSQLLGRDVSAARSIGGQHGVRHYRIELADGTQAFAKISDRNGAAGLAATGQAGLSRCDRSHAGGPGPGWFRSRSGRAAVAGGRRNSARSLRIGL